MNKLTLREKIGYGLGDTACGLIWYSTIILLSYFYTDVLGIPPAIMGTLFLASRLIDTVTDPIMGLIVDRTRTKHGQFRPYLLWGAIPFAIMTMVTFYSPDYSETGKIVYASISYILLTLVYTFVNVPYCAMPGAITSDPEERHSLQSIRFFCSSSGQLIISGVALSLVTIIGQGDEKLGYFGSMSVIAILGAVLLLISFANTKEHNHFVLPDKKNAREDFKLLWKNTQWRLICVFKVMTATSAVVRGGTAIYFVKYVMENPDLTSQFLLYGSIASMLGSLFSAKLLIKFDRIKSYKLIIIIYSILSILLYLAPPSYIPLMFGLNIVFLFVMNTTTPVQWLMASDVIDHEESRSGRRLDGLIFSTYLFSIKLGLALGGALIGWTLAYVDYDTTLSVQSNTTIEGIKFMFCILPVIFNLGVYLILMVYKLDSKMINEVTAVLARKRAIIAENKVCTESDNAVGALTPKTVT